MPSIGKDYFATKLVSFFPLNKVIKKPSIYGTVILNDRKTGEPLAVINGSKLTAMRTAAVAAIGVRFLSPENISSIRYCRCGCPGFPPGSFCMFTEKYPEAICF